MQKFNQLDLCFLFIRTVGIVLVCWVVFWHWSYFSGWCHIHEPHSIVVISFSNDSGDTVLDYTCIVLVKEDVIATVVTELAK